MIDRRLAKTLEYIKIVQHISFTFVGNTHQLSILLTEACKLFLWCAQCVQSLHEESDLFACKNEKHRDGTESESLQTKTKPYCSTDWILLFFV